MEYGKILKALRVKSGLTQDQLAEKINRSRSCISKFESDKKVIDMPTFMQWVMATDSQTVAAALLFGIDSINIINTLLPLLPSFIGGFLLWM